MSNCLNILAILDGRPGHEKQTQGIIQALQAITQIKVTYFKINYGLRNYLSNLGNYEKKLKPLPNQRNNYDIIIGSGRHTHLSILLIASFTLRPLPTLH